jgi:hypothetical protein
MRTIPITHTLGNANVNAAIVLFKLSTLQFYRNLMNYGTDAKDCQATLWGWESDRKQLFNSKSNSGYVERQKKFITGKQTRKVGKKTITYPVYRTDNNINFVVPFLCCLDQLKGGIPSGVAITVELKIMNNAFKLLQFDSSDNTNYELNATSVYLHVPVCTLNRAIYKNIEDMWGKAKTLNLYFEQVEVRKLTCPTNTLHKKVSSFLQNATPNLLIIGFTPSAASDGAYNLNPFRFGKFFSKHSPAFSVNRETSFMHAPCKYYANNLSEANSFNTSYENHSKDSKFFSKNHKKHSLKRSPRHKKSSKKRKDKWRKKYLAEKLKNEMRHNKSLYMMGHGRKKKATGFFDSLSRHFTRSQKKSDDGTSKSSSDIVVIPEQHFETAEQSNETIVAQIHSAPNETQEQSETISEQAAIPGPSRPYQETATVSSYNIRPKNRKKNKRMFIQ